MSSVDIDDKLVDAVLRSRFGKAYPEPYAKMLRITEYAVKQVNLNVVPWSVYNKIYEIMSQAWKQLDTEMCIQEGFDLDR